MSSTRKLSELIMEYTAKNPNLKSMTRARRKYIWGLLIESVGDIDISDFGYCQAEDFQQSLYSRNLSNNQRAVSQYGIFGPGCQCLLKSRS